MSKLVGFFALAATLICLSFTIAAAQGSGKLKVVVPDSSIERPGDLGLRVHTNIIRVANETEPNPKLGAAWETPASLACVYRFVPQTPGCTIAGSTINPSGGAGAIAIVDAYDNPDAATDLITFSAKFGLPAADFTQVYANGKQPANNPGGWSLEEALDIEMAHAMAPNAAIYLVEAQTNSYADIFRAELVAAGIVAAAGGGEASNSWGGGENPQETTWDHIAFQWPGVVYLGAAGDSAFLVEYPAASPDVVAVGGTMILRDGQGDFSGEIYWDNKLGGGGGGYSAYEPKPSFQNPAVTGTQRGIPDLSFDADPSSGPAMYDADGNLGWMQAGGTSVAAPAVAGVINSAGHFYLNSTTELTEIYRDYSSPGYHSEFRDIVLAQPPCTTGWDICTGVGSPTGYVGK